MTHGDQDRIDSDSIDNLYHQHAHDLHAFVMGVLRDSHLAADVLQTTFQKAIEAGHTVNPDSFKGWLYRVALNEARLVRRRQSVSNRSLLKVARELPAAVESEFERACRREDVERVRQRMAMLSDKQQEVVRLRIYEQKTFAEISAELNIPLGTALNRMHTALKQLAGNLARGSD